jgi:hypothetical protein
MSEQQDKYAGLYRFAGICTEGNKPLLDQFAKTHKVARGAVAEVAILGFQAAVEKGVMTSQQVDEIMNLGNEKMRSIRGIDGRKARGSFMSLLKGYSPEDIEAIVAQIRSNKKLD